MPSNQFSKQTQQLSSQFGGYLNGGNGDSVVGGAIAGVPSAIGANQGIQDIPGDRLVCGMADALALSKTSVGTLYGGVYQYVTHYLSDTLAAVLGRAAFTRLASADDSYTVTQDEATAAVINLIQGVFINVITKGYSGYIQVAGKASLLFTTPLTGVAAIGVGVYVAADGVGRFDIFAGGGANPTFDQVDNMLNRYVGVAETAPTANTVSVVDMNLGRMRW